ncbi:hypothetical protein EDB81DRAFT_799062 [Dactylonectria macrodidyma]|uniref:Zn(2)-C6 fungal-type domain-containing protein n=1 Tax=Dactylonectria macrodidyma TaxID=307937 RepID=A0A9P9J0L0_9HYPO|nr:hypothetical protein EDB81DRAFT_799062 [Dactylonectria macrodidyma]
MLNSTNSRFVLSRITPMSSSRAVSAALRRKITIACEVCRKRKARCSGTVPCTLCLKQKLECHYETNRRKRGPRVRLADDESSVSENPQNLNQTESGSVLREAIVDNTDLSPSRECLVEPVIPCNQKLRQRLRQIYERCGQILDGVPNYVVSHLLEIFFTVVNHQQLPLLPPEQGLDWILESSRPPILLASLCLVSARYSSHEYISRERSSLSGNQIASKCRLMLSEPGTAKHHLDSMLSLCALALHEASNGNGAQAWCDIGLAQNTIPLISTWNLSDISSTVFRTGCDFIIWVRAGFAFGNSSLTSSISAYNTILSVINDSGPYTQTNIRDATKLLLNCVEYATQETQDDTIHPWQHGSTFSKLKLSLDQFSITIAQTFDLDPRAWESSLTVRSELAVETILSLIRDCCIILLNRAFLPISPQTQVDDEDQTQPPRMFLQGRIHACEASAESIYELCTVLISTQIFILPSFLGYCCFQAALVFMNALERCKHQPRREELADRFRVMFMVLGAQRKIYNPANLWIDALLRIHTFLSEPPSGYKKSQTMGLNFFSRFNGIQEPPLVNLADIPTDNEPGSSDALSESLLSADRVPEEAPTVWIDGYRMRLREQIEALAPMEDLQSPGTPDISASSSNSLRSPRLRQLQLETDEHCMDLQSITAVRNPINHADVNMEALRLDSPSWPYAAVNLVPPVPALFISDEDPLQGLLGDSMQLEGFEMADLDIAEYLRLGEAMFESFGLDWDQSMAQALSMTKDQGG